METKRCAAPATLSARELDVFEASSRACSTSRLPPTLGVASGPSRCTRAHHGTMQAKTVAELMQIASLLGIGARIEARKRPAGPD